MDMAELLDELPPERRLALAYAPSAVRADFLAVFLLDLRLSRLVMQRREPLLTQVRLSWWRVRLSEPASGFHHDEPVLALLSGWDDAQRGALVALVDGWEALLAEAPISDAMIMTFAEGRGAAFAALAARCGQPDSKERAARLAEGWALAELAVRTSDQHEAGRVRTLAHQRDWPRARLPRQLRSLAVLYGLARRKRGAGPLLSGLGDWILAIRLGLSGT